MGDAGPVRVGACPEPDTLEQVAVPLDQARGGAARALDAADADRPLGVSRAALGSAYAALEQSLQERERLAELEQPLLEAGADVAVGESGMTGSKLS